MNQYIIYTHQNHAWLQSDDMTSKLARAVNYSGIRLIRGWDEVLKFQKKVVKSRKDSISSIDGEKIKEANLTNLTEGEPVSDTSGVNKTDKVEPIQQDKDEEERDIRHLVFVIHGIGQKLGERVDSVNFAGDCGLLRKTMKETASQILKESPKEDIDIPLHGGVQVLPIMWRQKLKFGISEKMQPAVHENINDKKDNDDKDLNPLETTLEDITLDTVQSIRMLVSDVVLDGNVFFIFIKIVKFDISITLYDTQISSRNDFSCY
jgi:hypothetical protein